MIRRNVDASALFPTLDDLDVYADGAGGVWYPLQQVVRLLGQPTTGHVTKYIERGHRMKRMVKVGDWRMNRFKHYIDGAALVEVCRALGMMRGAEVRAFVQKNTTMQGQAKA